MGGDKLWHKLEKMLEIVQKIAQIVNQETIQQDNNIQQEVDLITLQVEVVRINDIHKNVFFLVTNYVKW